jgi:hypothetical protein
MASDTILAALIILAAFTLTAFFGRNHLMGLVRDLLRENKDLKAHRNTTPPEGKCPCGK